MAITRPVSDLQRNINEIYELCQESGQPVYLTRNGKASLVIMDAEAYDEQVDLREAIYQYEMRLYRQAIEAHEEFESGGGTNLHDIRREMGLE